MSDPKLSVVLPVRDRQHDIAERVERVLEALITLTREPAEVVVVDDGSRDATPEVLDDLSARYPQVRIIRHGRPRGMEAAGQTGLECSTGELVFIQESNTAVRIEDMRRLLRMAEDDSVVAARAESTPKSLSPELVRRLRAWGTDADQRIDSPVDLGESSSLQMLRRPHLQKLAGNQADRMRLQGETMHTTSVQKR
ncbi:glycosyltransferase family 2 protein [Stieleria varia]|uniref:Putative glycosyltransferase EpsH n=1 Tax=Stieleria varia TaxID=2528005 RepID=A0A5C6A1X8_9BACT|nr:glycosyltransferase family 2 protein [Stieleria varia]TWT93241.1 putative glycosyltransferase EpsH [Stieleria varia]